MNPESFRGKTFTVTDADARLRKPSMLGEFMSSADGSPVRIPKGTKIHVDEVRIAPAGVKAVNLFVNAAAADGSGGLGWTSAANLQGTLLSETVGAIPPEAGANRFGPNAAWSKGVYREQVTLV